MSSKRSNDDRSEVRVELKYCEHCGGLWVRERGSGAVFCERCEAKVEDFPMRKKRPGRVRLPDGPQREQTYGVVFEDEPSDLDAMGGVA